MKTKVYLGMASSYLCNEYGRCILTMSKCLVGSLSKHFVEQLLISSSPALAEILVFQTNAILTL